MALSKIDTTNMIEDVPQSKLDNNINFRNIIINGDMSIAQRGTSATVSDGSNEGYNTLDRFYTNFNAGIGGAVDLTQDTTVPANQGFAKSLKIQCQTTSTSFSGNMNLQVYQVIEAQNLQYLSYGSSSPKNIVFSFWCKADNYTSPLSAIFRTMDGTVEYFVKSFTPTSTWQKFTFSVPGSTSATIDNDNGAGLRVGICLAGSTDNEAPDSTSWSTTRKDLTDTQGNFLSSTSNILYITGVQLEAGTTASDFETLPTDINLIRCQRYYEKSNNLSLFPGDTNADGYYLSNMTRASSNQNYFTVFYKARKRVEATVTIYSYNTGASGKYRDGTNAVDYDASVGRSGEINFVMRPTSSTGVSLGDVMGFQWEADAEL